PAEAPPRAAGRRHRRCRAPARGRGGIMQPGTAMRGALSCVAVALFAATAVRAAEPIEIFDAHLHYNWEPKPYYGLDEVLALFKKHRALAYLRSLIISRPAKYLPERGSIMPLKLIGRMMTAVAIIWVSCLTAGPSAAVTAEVARKCQAL